MARNPKVPKTVDRRCINAAAAKHPLPKSRTKKAAHAYAAKIKRSYNACVTKAVPGWKPPKRRRRRNVGF